MSGETFVERFVRPIALGVSVCLICDVFIEDVEQHLESRHSEGLLRLARRRRSSSGSGVGSSGPRSWTTRRSTGGRSTTCWTA